MRPDIQIIARGEVPSAKRQLLQAGANCVVLPAHIGADRIAHWILHPNAREVAIRREDGNTEMKPDSTAVPKAGAALVVMKRG
jgi:voltage-gated potassium channel